MECLRSEAKATSSPVLASRPAPRPTHETMVLLAGKPAVFSTLRLKAATETKATSTTASPLNPPKPPQRLDPRLLMVIRAIQSMSKLRPDWDARGAPPPNVAALYWAKTSILIARERGFPLPDRVRPTAEGGVAMIFGTTRRVASLEFFNDGEIASMRLVDGRPQYQDVDADDAALFRELRAIEDAVRGASE